MLDCAKYLTIFHQEILVISNLEIPDSSLILHPYAVHMYEKNIFHKNIQLRNTCPFFLEFSFMALISKF